MKKILLILFLLSIVFTGCGSYDDEENEILNGTITCTRYEESGGENAKSTIVATFKNQKVISAYSTLEFKDGSAAENVCMGLQISNDHNEKKIDFECGDLNIKFLNYFQLQEKSEYTSEEFYLEFKSLGFACEATASE